jgi:hypothetical protein
MGGTASNLLALQQLLYSGLNQGMLRAKLDSACLPQYTNCTCACVHGFAVAIWRAVAEDYAPFDVDVTTFKPNVSDTSLARA